ncbi:MAG: 5-methyltetrahydropteroyltriglutamate--homocysteine S-methyltransferase, partial [Elioraea sp.]|nr:5-methyltetrahydropteroyltriglutamate--homocysteine S-methyltransferase [Elioraea sp.]
PCGDFSLYDHVLDTAVCFGAVPPSHAPLLRADRLAGYFALARGLQDGRHDLRPLELTKWFDTNYHYLVPELSPTQDFVLDPREPLERLAEARAAGFKARPVLLGPVSFLSLAKTTDGSDPLALLDRLLPCYLELLKALAAAGASWVQLDEPLLATDLDEAARRAYARAFAALAPAPRPRLLLATYFGPLRENLDLALASGCEGLHLDLVRGAEDLEPALAGLP